MWGKDVVVDASTTSALSKNGNRLGITAEKLNITLNPLKCQRLVHEAIVTRSNFIFSAKKAYLKPLNHSPINYPGMITREIYREDPVDN